MHSVTNPKTNEIHCDTCDHQSTCLGCNNILDTESNNVFDFGKLTIETCLQ